MQLPLTAAVIAAILLGAGDPQIANAAIAASIGGSTQAQLDFSRSHEKEADFIGIQLLASAGYDPQGMSSFFSRMQEGTKYYGAGVPEFLRTHPVTTSRIAEAEGRARQFRTMHKKQDSINYLLARARIRLLTATSIDHLQRTIETEKGNDPDQQEAHQYLLALVQQQKGKIGEARAGLQALLKAHPDRITYIYSLAELESAQKNGPAAIALYRTGLRQYPGNPLLTLALAETHIALKQNAAARALLEQLTRKHPQADAYRLQADLEAQAGNMAASHLARAEYYYLIHEPHSALDQLTNAKRLPNLPHYFALRIDARMQQIKEEIQLAHERSSL
jgi:beta-barrel assembly-enhancing protease